MMKSTTHPAYAPAPFGFSPKGVSVLRREDAGYPARLLKLEMPPAQIYLRGRWDAKAPAIAIVGTREATPKGAQTAFVLARELCSLGIGVVSGGALGIDAAAHRGALAQTGKTCVVMGTGVDLSYPQRHHTLFEEVVTQGGCLLSGFPLGTPAKVWHFPARNTLIAGLADAVVVIEAGLQSGTRHTAVAAEGLSVPVLAFPGSPGTDELLRQGAVEVHGVGDVLAKASLSQLGISDALTRQDCEAEEEPDEDAEKVRRALSATPADIGELCGRTGLPPATCAAAVVDLELHGLCVRLAGGLYVRMEHAS